MAEPRQLSFSVDTHLLRELGALLVGRDSTALLELIKNSYDADATTVTVFAEGLAQGQGRIVVSDDGLGMTLARFDEAFLRIAGRSKETGERRSALFRRRYTGAKGIGRLAAHKLSSRLEVISVPDKTTLGNSPDASVGVRALMDWDAMENGNDDLTNLSSDALEAFEVPVLPEERHGTAMALERLRGEWPNRRLGDFLAEVRSCQPSTVLLDPLPSQTVAKPVLFGRPIARDTGNNDPGFEIELTGDLAGSENLWKTLSERADWVLEIDSNKRQVVYGIAPTLRKREALQSTLGPYASDWLEARSYARPHPSPKDGPFFQVRILVTEGSVSRQKRFADLRAFERQDSGIRVYMEGFRVLPYGGQGDDWLRLDADHVRRVREFDTPEDLGFDALEKEGLVQLGNRAYYGAVFLTEAGVAHLQSLVNREGFVPDEYFHTFRSLVRTGPDLVSRTRAAIRDLTTEYKNQLKAEEEERKRKQAGAEAERERLEAEGSRSDIEDDTDPPSDTSDNSEGDPHQQASLNEGDHDDDGSGDTNDYSDTNGSGEPDDLIDLESPSSELERLLNIAAFTASDISAATTEGLAQSKQVLLQSTLRTIGLRLEAVQAEQANLRTLATVGAQYSGFIHEINGLLGQAQTLRRLLDALAKDLTAAGKVDMQQRRDIRTIIMAADELILSLTRQASYLTEVIGPDARRRRTRMPVEARIRSALRLLTLRLRERNLQVDVDVDPALKTPPLFAAEVSIVITNLMSNAIKFAGDGGRIQIQAWLDERARLHLLVQNTGVGVADRDRERFFRPFESSTTEVDLVLGQGMGLGLPIVRNLAEDYGGTADFVDASNGFVTAIEVVIPDPRPDIAQRG